MSDVINDNARMSGVCMGMGCCGDRHVVSPQMGDGVFSAGYFTIVFHCATSLLAQSVTHDTVPHLSGSGSKCKNIATRQSGFSNTTHWYARMSHEHSDTACGGLVQDNWCNDAMLPE